MKTKADFIEDGLRIYIGMNFASELQVKSLVPLVCQVQMDSLEYRLVRELGERVGNIPSPLRDSLGTGGDGQFKGDF